MTLAAIAIALVAGFPNSSPHTYQQVDGIGSVTNQIARILPIVVRLLKVVLPKSC